MIVNLTKYNTLMENADDFLEAALRCCFNDSIKLKKYPLIIPNFVNKAFACELYLKATLYLIENKIPKIHKINELFLELSEKNRQKIYDIWRTIEGQNIQDCDDTREMFDKNLEANSNIFTKFRYSHEWVGSSISLQNSFAEEQMHLHNLTKYPIYDGFLEQLAKSIKKHNTELVNFNE